MVLVVKKMPANERDIRDAGLNPASGRSPRGGYCNPLQYSCLENPMNRGAWWTMVHRVPESQTQQAAWHACTMMIRLQNFPFFLGSFQFLLLTSTSNFATSSPTPTPRSHSLFCHVVLPSIGFHINVIAVFCV